MNFTDPSTSRSKTFCQAWPCSKIFWVRLQFQKLKIWKKKKNILTVTHTQKISITYRHVPSFSIILLIERVNIPRFCSLIKKTRHLPIPSISQLPAWRSSMFACTFRMRSFNPPPIFPKTLTSARGWLQPAWWKERRWVWWKNLRFAGKMWKDWGPNILEMASIFTEFPAQMSWVWVDGQTSKCGLVLTRWFAISVSSLLSSAKNRYLRP